MKGHRPGCKCVGCSPATRARGMASLRKRNPSARRREFCRLCSHKLARGEGAAGVCRRCVALADASPGTIVRRRELEERGSVRGGRPARRRNPSKATRYRFQQLDGKVQRLGFRGNKVVETSPARRRRRNPYAWTPKGSQEPILLLERDVENLRDAARRGELEDDVILYDTTTHRRVVIKAKPETPRRKRRK